MLEQSCWTNLPCKWGYVRIQSYFDYQHDFLTVKSETDQSLIEALYSIALDNI